MAKGDFAIISECHFIREDEFSELHECMKPGQNNSSKKEIVMRRCGSHGTDDMEKIGTGKRRLLFDRCPKSSHAPCHGT